MPETPPEGDLALLKTRVENLETSISTLKSDILTAMRALFELLDADGPLSIKLAAIEKALSELQADVRTTDDAVGDTRTISAIETTLSEIKAKVGVRS
jgi:hypothetical protein